MMTRAEATEIILQAKTQNSLPSAKSPIRSAGTPCG